MSLPPIILASASPRRLALLRQMGLQCRVMPSEVEEVHEATFPAPEIARINAQRKAVSVANQFPDDLIIGADTLVYLEGKLYGKPRDWTDAERMLRELEGRTHQVVTAVCLVHQGAARQNLFAEISQVTFKPLTAEAIRSYLSSINPLDKAGAYAIQENGEKLVERVSGSLSNVVGLPVERLQTELSAWEQWPRENRL